MPHPAANFARYLAAAYALLTIYASLHPFTDWRDSGAPLLEFLAAGWPRYYTLTDIALNLLTYLPLGFLLVPALHPLNRFAAVVIAACLTAGLSLGLETLQNFLPARFPTNLDFACNSGGGLLGALLGARWGAAFTDGGRLHHWRVRHIMGGKAGDTGLLLLALWLLTQLNPETLLFGNGDVRALLDIPPPLSYSAERFLLIELAVAASATLAAGLLAWRLLRAPRYAPLAVLLLLALAIKTGASALLSGAAEFAHWMTSGNSAGIAAGVMAFLLASFMSATAQRTLAAASLLIATTLVNLAPENPYLIDTLAVWQQGHFLNFNGLTRLASALWPFLALLWLMLPRDRSD